MKKISAMQARQGFGEILNQVNLLNEEFVVERAGKSLAKIVPVNAEARQKLDFRDITKLPSV